MNFELGPIHKRRLLRGGGRESPLKADLLHLNYYLSGAICVSVCLSVRKKLFLLYGFGEQTSRVLEFKPEGLEGYVI